MPLAVEKGPAGLRVAGTRLYLDAHRPTEVCCVSHAHGDHIARHRRVLATPATLHLMEHRLGTLRSPVALPYQQVHQEGDLTVDLFPAGHVLGSAQVRISQGDDRLVYSGDLNLAPSLTAEPWIPAPCQTLVMECTFGHPRYRFPPREEVHQAMVAFVEQAFADQVLPVFLAYPLGKSQEAIVALTRAGHRVVAHESIARLCERYTALGVPVPCRKLEHSVLPGEVLFYPPRLGKTATLQRLAPVRRAVLTGWALDPGAAARYGAEVAFPLSDHADYPGLLAYARASGARRVLTVHGFCDEFAATLREQGLDAQPL